MGVAPASGRSFVIAASVPHQDLARTPVEVVVSDRRSQACRFQVSTPAPVECRLTIAPGETAVLVQVDVSRLWPTPAGDRGALVVTRFVPR